MEDKKWLIYFEGNDEKLKEAVNNTNLFENYTIIFASNGFLQNQYLYLGNNSEEHLDHRLDENLVVYTNDVNLLNLALYDDQIKNYRVSFLVNNKINDLKDIYPNIRKVNNIQKMYMTGLFGNCEIIEKPKTFELSAIYLDTYTNEFVKQVDRFAPPERYLEICATSLQDCYVDTYRLKDGKLIDFTWSGEVLSKINVENFSEAYAVAVKNYFEDQQISDQYDDALLIRRGYPKEKFKAFLEEVK